MLICSIHSKRSWEVEEESSFEHTFNSLQQYPSFFVFELFAMVYLMMVLALVADEFLMPSLKNIATRYQLSKDLTGFIVAIGNLVPELTTTILSFLRHGVKMTEFAIATNVGSSLFALTIVPAFAAYFSPPPEKINGVAVPALDPSTFFRDLGFFIFSLIFYSFAFSSGVCSLFSCCILLSMVFVYLYIVGVMNRRQELEEAKKMYKDDEQSDGSAGSDEDSKLISEARNRKPSDYGVSYTIFDNTIECHCSTLSYK